MNSVLKNGFLIVQGTNRKLRYDFSLSALDFFRDKQYPIPPEAQHIQDQKLQPVPMEIGDFEWTGPSRWPNQIAGISHILKWKRGYLAHGMGCGKSCTALSIADYLVAHGIVRHTLIVCPKSVQLTVWPKMHQTYSGHTKFYSITDTKKGKKFLDALNSESDPTVVVINYDKVKNVLQDLLRVRFALVIADEAHSLKNPRSQRSKCVAELSDKSTYSVVMSGTPVSKNMIDIFGQYRVMDPFWFGKSDWFFKKRYCEMGGWMQHQIVGYKNEQELRRIMDTPAHVILKRDALPGLPPKVFSERVFQMSPDEQRIYKETKRKFLVELNDGRINIANAASRIQKLQEIANGFVITETGDISRFGETKLSGLMDEIEETGEADRVTVWCRFREDIAAIGHKMAHLLPERAFLAYHGDTKDRNAVLERFRATEGAVLAIQTQSGGMGLDLTCSHISFRYSRLFSWMDEEQAADRHHRPGQVFSVSYTDFIMEDTVDRKIQSVLEDRRSLSEWVTEKKGSLKDLFNDL